MVEVPENNAGLREILAIEILDKIRKGEPIEYDHVIIRGYIDASELDLQEDCNKFHISSPIKITNSIFSHTIKFNNIIFQKNVDFYHTTFGGDHEIIGCASFFNSQFNRSACFGFAKFEETVNFVGSKFKWGADFMYCKFRGPVDFSGSQFDAKVVFNSSLFYPDADFSDSQFNKGAFFRGCKFNGINFEKTMFVEEADFKETEFSRETNFIRVQFNGKIDLNDSKFIGDVLTFKNAKFNEPRSQENVCRKAKNVLEKNGDREEAGYHFYREMEGKRKQKESDYKYFDYEALLFYKDTDASPRELTDLYKYLRYNLLDYLFIQVIFGYGVHPFRLWGFWVFFVALFAVVYWMGDGVNNLTTAQPLTDFREYFWFSITVAVTPGFAGYKPAPGFYQVLAGVEAIFGTFMWAAFITTFARKYMR